MINDIWYIHVHESISDSHTRCIVSWVNTRRKALRKMPGSTPSSPHVQRLVAEQTHCEQISVTSLNLQCAPVEKGVPSAVSSSLAASLKMAESVGAVCTWGYPRSDKAKWRCPNEHPFFSAELPVTWTQNQRNMRHHAHWTLTFEGLIKLSLNWNTNTGARTREPKRTTSLCR